ncbi:MAG: hypothetical protein QOI93_5519 [Rhodospirillaceae bacterium]|jgi:hypothetical protein|nr:hypothetical protein [Rhodospirillaceae bacterium]
MGPDTIENTNFNRRGVTELKGAQPTLNELCAGALKTRGERGCRKGSGRKRVEDRNQRRFANLTARTRRFAGARAEPSRDA